MKLISCYIENFGKLSSFKYDFSDGLNLISGENGYGKTTLTVFLKAMFYGLDSKKTRNEENERKKYLPWQGGRCGGSLVFEKGGKKYRIERTFKDKPTSDEFTLYDAISGRAVNDYSENIGEELFEIDADGFERTLFLSERKLTVKNENQTIGAKLSNLAGADGDMGNLDRAMDALEKREKYYKHRRGRGGIIGEIEDSISATEREIIELQRKKRELSEIEDLATETEKEIKLLEAKRKEIEKLRLGNSYNEQYGKMKRSLLSYEEKLDKEKTFFSKKMTSKTEIATYEEKYAKASALEESIKNDAHNLNNLSDSDTRQIEKLLTIVSKIEEQNVNKTFHIFYSISIISCFFAILLGYLISPLFYTAAVITPIFAYLGAKNRKRCKELIALKEQLFGLMGEFFKDCTCKSVAEIKSFLYQKKAEVNALAEQYKNTATLIAEKEEQLSLLRAECCTFIELFPTETDSPFSEIREHLTSYLSLLEYTENARRELDLFAAEHGINDSEAADFMSGEVPFADGTNIDDTLRTLRSKYYSLKNEATRLTDEIIREDVLEEKKIELKDKLLEAKFFHSVTVKTAAALLAAKEKLTEKYLGKTRSAFNFYLGLLSEEDPADFSMDTDFSLKKTENGITKPQENYSLGKQELYSIITRLALAEALYGGDVPFIVLDDPFCHLDDKRCQSALKLIQKLSSQVQIIYLTCSAARIPHNY